MERIKPIIEDGTLGVAEIGGDTPAMLNQIVRHLEQVSSGNRGFLTHDLVCAYVREMHQDGQIALERIENYPGHFRKVHINEFNDMVAFLENDMLVSNAEHGHLFPAQPGKSRAIS